MTILPLSEAHWPAVRAIYEAGIRTGNATLETQAPEWAGWHAAHLPHSRLVAADARGQLLGWAALSPVSGRCVYGGVAEVSVYIAPEAQGQGVGLALLQALVQASEQHGIWTLQAGILQENTASLALHAKAGFRTIGYRERIGQLHGQWRTVMLLERRSAVVGTEQPAGITASANAR
ncbi:N-acetyltransferase family protein [Hymenobacter busanensis]|uniref:N-acetyltransferase family protein n=1 Tax=Hymenobacter busanensis TaxID=2607656 RepID=A0A7L4ZW54_9BACT|nr:GNAT family N-acetyltransferase [Hymenobacter busanensis]KAA9339163.1 N-acetyltransferase family protein [Hymenobacter busanensis]QHJ07075.1 GNAT family N-acetyltransferase [Hymenobacter busanensis]